jgi:hypothetical protein
MSGKNAAVFGIFRTYSSVEWRWTSSEIVVFAT